ncbi:hypothetical protein D3C81_791540 [compost metagenome]
MHVRPGSPPGRAHTPDHLAPAQLLPHLHIDLRHMAEHADKALPVVDEHRTAIEEVIAHQNHLAIGRGLDRRAGRHREVQPGMWVAFFAIEETAHAELARQRATDRLVEDQVARQGRAEAAIGLDLLGQLTIDALEVSRVRVDLAGVLQGDALLGVLFTTYAERQGTAALAQHRGAGLLGQRDANDGQPVVLLFHHQHRLAVEAGAGRTGGGAEVDHRHAAGYRLVQRAGDVAGLGAAGQQQEGKGKQGCEQAGHVSVQK